MDRLSELARDVRRAADEVVARVELMQDAAPSAVASSSMAARQAFLLDLRDAFDRVSELAERGSQHADDCYRSVT